MKKLMIAMIALMASMGQAQAQGVYEEGVHYFKIEQPAGFNVVDGVRVTEAFSYLCNHCMTFEPYVQAWVQRKPEGVEFKRIPVEFGRSTWGLYARAYVAASIMGIEDKAHVPLMDAIWKDRKPFRSMDELAEFYAQFGVEKDKFLATAKSFAVDMQMRREQAYIRSAEVSGTPTLLVNAKYRVQAGGPVAGFDDMLAVVDYLVQQELAREAAEQSALSDQPTEALETASE